MVVGGPTTRDEIVNLHTIHTVCADRQHVPSFCLSGTIDTRTSP